MPEDKQATGRRSPLHLFDRTRPLSDAAGPSARPSGQPPPPLPVAPSLTFCEDVAAAAPRLPTPMAIPKIPNFKDVRSSGAEVAASAASTAARSSSPTIPKIPNFSRVHSSGSASSLDLRPASGSLSAREADRPAAVDDLEKRRPLTSRPSSMGLTPRNRAMLGPRPGDRSMRGMDSVLGVHAMHFGDATPRTPRDGEGTPRTPRSPRGSGGRPRRGADECAPKSPRRAQAGPTGGGGAGGGGAGGSDWLQAALDAARGRSGGGHGTWLPHAAGCAVIANDLGAPGSRGRAVGVVVGEVAGSAGALWELRLIGAGSGDGGSVYHAKAASLRRLPPAKGDRARCVLGDSAGVEGEVLSVEGGVAVVKPRARARLSVGVAAKGLGSAGGASTAVADRRVRVLPVDALCRLDLESEAEVSGTVGNAAGGEVEGRLLVTPS